MSSIEQDIGTIKGPSSPYPYPLYPESWSTVSNQWIHAARRIASELEAEKAQIRSLEIQLEGEIAELEALRAKHDKLQGDLVSVVMENSRFKADILKIRAGLMEAMRRIYPKWNGAELPSNPIGDALKIIGGHHE